MTKNPKQALKAISEVKRFKILEMLMKSKGGIMVGKLNKQLKIDPTLLSHHLSILRGATLITAERIGKQVNYAINSKSKLVDADKKTIKVGSCLLSF